MVAVSVAERRRYLEAYKRTTGLSLILLWIFCAVMCRANPTNGTLPAFDHSPDFCDEGYTNGKGARIAMT